MNGVVNQLIGVRVTLVIVLAVSASLWSPSVTVAQSIESAWATTADSPDNPVQSLEESSSTLMDYRTLPGEIGLQLSMIKVDPSVPQPDDPRSSLRIGVPLMLPEHHQGNLLRNATWTTLPNGSQITSITLHSKEATRLRVAVRAILPEDARLRFFGSSQTHSFDIPVYLKEHFESRGADRIELDSSDSSGVIWSPIVDGDTLGIEIQVSSSRQIYETQLQVVLASHIYDTAVTTGTRQQPPNVAHSEKSCPLVDVACKDLTGLPHRAVTKVSATDTQGRTYSCSGTVINTHRPEIDNSLDPYVLTTYGCITTEGEADSAVFDFFYNHDTCNGSDVSSEHVRIQSSGAQLLTTDPSTNLSLLKLRSPLPQDAGLAGWSADLVGLLNSDSEVISIAHSDGMPQSYVSGNPSGYGTYKINDQVVDSLNINLTEGVVLPGGFGGGVWVHDEDADQWRLIGALAGAPIGPACPMEEIKVGRFDYFFVNEAQQYLNPDELYTDDYGGSFASATSILLGSDISGEIDHRADADMFRIEVSEPGVLLLTTTGSTNLVGRLLQKDGSVIESDVEAGYLDNFRISAHVDAGTYYVRVSGWDPDAIGSYRLHTTFTASSALPAAEMPLFLASSHNGRQSLIRLVNFSEETGTVLVTAFDDEGVRYGPMTIAFDSYQTIQFNSEELENGNLSKGFVGSTGSGAGDWRLRFDTELEIEVTSYIQTTDGFLTPMHDTVYLYERYGVHFVPIFNPSSNIQQMSKLRLVNPHMTREISASIFGQDDAGRLSAGRIDLTLPPGASRTFDASQLESGDAELRGSLGDGVGRWRLWVEADGDIVVLNLLDSFSGHLSNLSSPGHIIE